MSVTHTTSKLFQVGTKEGPKLEVRFGLSELDSGKRWRTISVYPDCDEILNQLHGYDIKIDEKNGKDFLNIKISSIDTKFVGYDGGMLSANQIRRGDRVILVVKPFDWSFNGKKGVSLQAKTVMVCGSGDDEEDFVIM